MFNENKIAQRYGSGGVFPRNNVLGLKAPPLTENTRARTGLLLKEKALHPKAAGPKQKNPQ
jgi:hypothetical protein